MPLDQLFRTFMETIQHLQGSINILSLGCNDDTTVTDGFRIPARQVFLMTAPRQFLDDIIGVLLAEDGDCAISAAELCQLTANLLRRLAVFDQSNNRLSHKGFALSLMLPMLDCR